MEIMLTRQKVIDSIKKMPETFSVDELFERILLLQKIQDGLSDVEKGQVISDEALSDELPEWLR